MIDAARTADAHIHMFANGYPGDRQPPVPAGTDDLAAYERIRDSAGIGDALVVGFEGAPFAIGNNHYIRSLATERDWMHTTAYIAAGADPTAVTAREVLADGHVGISIYAADVLTARAIRDWAPSFWVECDTAAAVVSINATPAAIEQMTALPSRAPNCAFLFAHLGMPGRYATAPPARTAVERIGALLSLAEQPNCHVKLSGLYAVSDPPTAYPHDAATPFVAACLEYFGSTRCLWGSDFSPALEYLTFDQCRDLPQLDALSDTDRQLVMGGNLHRVLRGFRSGCAPDRLARRSSRQHKENRSR